MVHQSPFLPTTLCTNAQADSLGAREGMGDEAEGIDAAGLRVFGRWVGLHGGGVE